MKNPAVDAYIAKSPDFAQPILKRVRALMHKACPKIEESIKWGVPHFDYKGIVAGMAAFKAHAAFGFWSSRLLKEKLAKDSAKLFPTSAEAAMFGRKLRSVEDLPPDALLVKAIKAAVALNEAGVRPKRSPEEEAAGEAAALSRGRTPEKCESEEDFRWIHSVAAARVRRVAHRREAGVDARTAPRHDCRVARRRQAAQLEVPELLTR